MFNKNGWTMTKGKNYNLLCFFITTQLIIEFSNLLFFHSKPRILLWIDTKSINDDHYMKILNVGLWVLYNSQRGGGRGLNCFLFLNFIQQGLMVWKKTVVFCIGPILDILLVNFKDHMFRILIWGHLLLFIEI